MASTDFTIADVLAWARTKPADEVYNFCNSNVCAFAQFGLATGRPQLVGVGGSCVLYGMSELYHALATAVNFGELVDLLEPLCPETPVTKSDWLAIDAYLTDDLVSA